MSDYRIVQTSPKDFEVWRGEQKLSRHPNKGYAASQIKNYEAADNRRAKQKAKTDDR